MHECAVAYLEEHSMEGKLQRVFLVIVLLFVSFEAKADISKWAEFRSSLAAESALDMELKPWTPAQKAKVTALFEDLAENSPGLLARAMGPGKIMLYRAKSSPSHVSGAWVRRRHEASFIFTDVFFKGTGNNHLGVEYTNWLFIHEITHLADPVDQIARSYGWSRIIENRLALVAKDVGVQGLNMRQAMFKRMDALAQSYGFPSIYAATSRHEALAEFVASVYFGLEISDDIAMFVKEEIYSSPAKEAKQLSALYRAANLEMRKNNYPKAIKYLNKAIRLSPDFSQGWYLRGFAQLGAKNFQKARADFDQALQLIPEDDRAARNDVLNAKKWMD